MPRPGLTAASAGLNDLGQATLRTKRGTASNCRWVQASWRRGPWNTPRTGDGVRLPLRIRQRQTLQRVVDRLQGEGAFARCVWPTGEVRCGRPADMVVEAIGMVDTLSLAWMPACRWHAPLSAHWLTTRLLSMGRARAVPLDAVSMLGAGSQAGRLFLPPQLSTGVPDEARRAKVAGDPVGAAGDLWDSYDPAGHAYLVQFELGGELTGRLVGPALPLPPVTTVGRAAELACYDAAATWGMPDFVFRPHAQRKGSGVREVGGDGLILLRDSAMVVQVKRRESATDDPAKEQRWLKKVAAKAERQVHGSIRMLHIGAMEFENVRGRRLLVGGRNLDCLGVVILDHDDVPQDVLIRPERPSVVVLTRRDWEFLFGQLKSSHAVASYLRLMADEEAVPLDQESARYYGLAAAEGEVDTSWRRYFTDAERLSGNAFPVDLPSGDDAPHVLFRTVLEDIALMGDADDAADRQEVLCLLDSLPVPARVTLGQRLLRELRQASHAHRWLRRWRSQVPVRNQGRLRIGGAYPQIVYTVATEYNDRVYDMHEMFLTWQHHQYASVDPEREDVWTVGILLIVPSRDTWTWETVVSWTTGHLNLPPEGVEVLRTTFGPHWDDAVARQKASADPAVST